MPLPELATTLARFGDAPYLLTVGPDATPHAASVSVEWSDGVIRAGVGRQTAANLATNPAVALLWPPPSPGDYSLIVDGSATVEQSGPHRIVVIEPTSAVLHVSAKRP